VGVALANLSDIYRRQEKYPETEKLLRQAVAIQLKARGEDNVDTAIARIKLGRTLLKEKRYQAAEQQTRAGYEALKRQSSAPTSFLEAARADLIAIDQVLGKPPGTRVLGK
jgi:hypothetical protein